MATHIQRREFIVVLVGAGEQCRPPAFGAFRRVARPA
jgi:hypothetical protein